MHYRMHFGRDPRGHLAAGVRLLPGRRALSSPPRTSASSSSTSHGAGERGAPAALRRLRADLHAEPAWRRSRATRRAPAGVERRDTAIPGDPVYREFYRDIGWDLDYDYVRPYIQATGERKNTGIKYYRITGKIRWATRSPTTPRRARARAEQHAGNFLFNREQAGRVPRRRVGRRAAADRRLPVRRRAVRALVVRGAASSSTTSSARRRCEQDVLRAGDAGRLPARAPGAAGGARRRCRSWGAGGTPRVWLDGANDWIYRHLHKAAERMVELARDCTRTRARCSGAR